MIAFTYVQLNIFLLILLPVLILSFPEHLCNAVVGIQTTKSATFPVITGYQFCIFLLHELCTHTVHTSFTLCTTIPLLLLNID